MKSHLASNHNQDEYFMNQALEQARLAEKINEVPIGAIAVYDGAIIAKAHNIRETNKNPSGHAEFLALMEASRKLGRWRLSGVTVYVTLEPCLMCAGLMVNSRVDRCVYGAYDKKGGALGTLYSVHEDERLNHSFDVQGGVCEDECAKLMSDFFKNLRTHK